MNVLTNLTNEDVTRMSNISVDVCLNALYKDKIIDKETLDKAREYRVVATSRSVFGKLFSKLTSKDELDKLYINAVKVIQE